jgi:hypothetical protein
MRFTVPIFLVFAVLSARAQVAYSDAEQPYIVEGLSIEMSFDDAMQRLEQSGYNNRMPVTENRKGRNVKYNKVVSRSGSIKSNTVQLFERQLDMDMALSEIRAKLFNPAGESGKALEYQRLIDHFGADAPECRDVGKKLICKLTLQDGPLQTTIEGKFDPNWIVYNIIREYQDNVEDPFSKPPGRPAVPQDLRHPFRYHRLRCRRRTLPQTHRQPHRSRRGPGERQLPANLPRRRSPSLKILSLKIPRPKNRRRWQTRRTPSLAKLPPRTASLHRSSLNWPNVTNPVTG